MLIEMWVSRCAVLAWFCLGSSLSAGTLSMEAKLAMLTAA